MVKIFFLSVHDLILPFFIAENDGQDAQSLVSVAASKGSKGPPIHHLFPCAAAKISTRQSGRRMIK